jgi:hypothetical protein
MSSNHLSNTRSTSTEQIVNIHSLKNFVLTNLPENWALRTVLLLEPDKMKAGEFLAKIDVWLKLTQVRRS